MSRLEFSRRTKRDAFARCKGHCEGCGFKLREGHFHYDHVKPTGWLEGDATLENCEVLCALCHERKTAREAGDKAKSDRIRDKRIGALTSRRGFPKAPPQRKASTPLERPLPPRRLMP
jgi:5-methylcytosine-specific restriction protein A